MAGRHRIQYEGGDTYEGEWSTDGKRHGRGTLTFANKARYVGEFVNGFFQGLGVLTLSDGARYEGSFEVGKYHGYGVYTAASGMKYEVRNPRLDHSPFILCYMWIQCTLL